MDLRIPVPSEVQQDLRQMIRSMAEEVIQDVKGREAESKPYMTVKETCKYLNISFSTLQKFEKYGLKKITVEGKILFSRKTVNEFMKDFEK